MRSCLRVAFLKILAICLLFVISGSGNPAKAEDDKVINPVPIPDNLKEGLVGYYSFDNNKAIDQSGESNDGVIHGPNREMDVSGEKNGSYRWNNDKDHIELPIDINIGSMPQVSLCAWVYPISYRGVVTVISNDDGGGDRKIFTGKRSQDKAAPWLWVCSNGAGGFIGKTPKELKKWVFIVTTYDETTKTAAIYVDGVKSSGRTTMDMGAPVTLIGANSRNNENFEALIDEVRIYNRVLSKAEIASLRALKPIIYDPKIEKEAKEKSYFYIPKQDNLIVRSKPSTQASSIGTIAKSDTLHFNEKVPNDGEQRPSWLKMKLEGKAGYVQLKYLEIASPNQIPQGDFEKKLRGYINIRKWQFWVIVLGMMLVGFGGSSAFGLVDQVLNAMTRNDYEGNAAFFPMVTGFAGALVAILMIIWQDQLDYYLVDNFTLWPLGYGFAAWAIWGIGLACALVFLILVFESIFCGNFFHMLLRIILQIILAAITFVSVFVMTIAVIFIAIAVTLGLVFLYAAFARGTHRGSDGKLYYDD